MGHSHHVGSGDAFRGLGDFYGDHAGGGGGFDAQIGVFEDKAVGGRYAEAFGSEEEAVGSRLAALVVFSADESIELVEQIDGAEGGGDGVAAAAGDDGKGNAAVLEVDVLDDLGDGLEGGDELVVKGFLAGGDFFNGKVEALHFIEQANDLADGPAAPLVEELFVVDAAVFGEGLSPGLVVERHGVNDGSVAVEQIGTEGARGEFEFHEGR